MRYDVDLRSVTGNPRMALADLDNDWLYPWERERGHQLAFVLSDAACVAELERLSRECSGRLETWRMYL